MLEVFRCYNNCMASPRRRRLLALVLAASTSLGLIGVSIATDGTDGTIPSIKPARLIASSERAMAGQFSISGEVETTIDLGLPVVPEEWGGESGIVGLVNGTNRYRLWRSPSGIRLAHVTDSSEQVLVANGRSSWWWDSVEFRATRVRKRDLLDALYTGWVGRLMAARRDSAATMATAGLSDPLRLTRSLLRQLAPTASVRVRGTTEIAGRPAYRLIMNPRSDITLIGNVSLAIDVETRLPLRVRVAPSGSHAAALEVGFTDVSFDGVDRSMFRFTPPAGAEVVDALDGIDRPRPEPRAIRRAVRRTGRSVSAIGSGFETRWIVRLKNGMPGSLAQQMPYQGPLVSALHVEGRRGDWILVGPVPLEVLQADADSIW